MSKKDKSRKQRQKAEDRQKRNFDERMRLLEERGGAVPVPFASSLQSAGTGIGMGTGRLQLRPRFQTDERAYAPDRDVAHLYPKLCKAALTAFDDPAKFPGWFGDLFRGRNVVRDDIAKAAQCLAKALNLFTADPVQVPNAYEAMKQAGFFDCRPEAQMAIYARLGEVVLGSFFVAIRDVTPLGGVPPCRKDVNEIAALAREMADHFKQATERSSDGPIKVD